MKKILLLLLMAVSLSNLKAQDEGSGIFSSKFYLGAKAGYGIVSFKSTSASPDDFAEKSTNNLSYGIVTGFRISDYLSIQAEGIYAQYGADNINTDHIYIEDNPLLAYKSPFSNIDHVDMDLYYADIPLTLRFSMSNGSFAPYVYAGVNWGINIVGYSTIVWEVDYTQGTVLGESVNDITEKIQYNEFAPIAGGGVNFTTGKVTIFGDVRYKYGVMNLSNVVNGTGFTNNALWFSAGLLFNL